MDKDQIVKKLIDMLHELQKSFGEEPQEITADTKPIGGMGGFSSLSGVAFTVDCIDGFGIPDDEKLQSIVVGRDEDKKPFARTVEQIADDIVERLTNK